MSCIRANVDITIVEGGTFNKTYQWKTGDPLTPVDLTGYSAHMQIRAKIKDVEKLLDIDLQSDDWVPEGDTGIYIYQVDEYDNDSWEWRIYIQYEDTEGLCINHKDIIGIYDLFLYNAVGEAVLQQYGTATIVASVTRDVG